MISKEMFVRFYNELQFVREKRMTFSLFEIDEKEADVIVDYDNLAYGMLAELMGIDEDDYLMLDFLTITATNKKTGETKDYDTSDADKMYDFICNVYPNVTFTL